MRRHLQKILLVGTLTIFGVSVTFAQSVVTGKIVDESGEPLIGASIVIPGTTQGVSTDFNGEFSLRVGKNDSSIEVAFVGFATELIEVGGKSNFGTITLQEDSAVLQDVVVTQSMAVQRKTPVAISTISADDIQFKIGSAEFPEMLKSTPGVHVTKAGGGFGDSKVSMRGFGQENVAVMVNGVPVNDMEWGGVYWSNWAGLSDVTSSMQSQRGLGASKISSPSVGGSINIVTRSIDAKEGGTLTTGVGNDGLFEMAFSVSSGLNDKGWAFSILGGKRWGDGYVQGANFEGYNYFVNVSKRINADHQLSLTAFGAPQTHNKRSYGLTIANWDTVNDYMKGESQYRYNSSFGYNSNGEAMTANTNFYHKPQISLNHQWQIDYKSSLSTALYVSIGQGGGVSGQGYSSTYRSYWNGSQDYGKTVATTFRNADGTFAYDQVEELNRTTEGSALMVLSESMNNHIWYGALSTYTNDINDNLEFSGGVDVRYYKGTHTNVISDLFGGEYYIDYSSRSGVDASNNIAAANPDWQYEKLQVGDVVYRDYDGLVLSEGVFGQLEYSNDRLSAFASGSLSNTTYWRVDRFYYDEANGTSDKVHYLGYTAKGGVNYNIDDKQNIFINGGYISRAPFFSGGAFLQSTTSNMLNPDGVNEKVASAEIGYGFRSQRFAANINAYYTKWMDKATVRSAQMDNGDYARLNMTGVDALHKGVEIDMQYRPTTWLSFKAMASLGDWIWDSVAKGYYYDSQGQPLADLDGTIASGVMEEDHAWQVLDQKGVRVGGSAQTTAALGMTVYPLDGLRVSADWTMAGNNYADFYISSSASAFSTQTVTAEWAAPMGSELDLSASYNFKVGKNRMTVYGNINNLFDYHYITDADIDATTIDATWQDVYNVYYSFGRTYTIRLKLNF
ncbi:MAG: TonB-dependent receptor plug domain-containing protein [Rikenellaceae bacterium]